MGPAAQWTIDPADYPAAGNASAKFRFFLRYAILAPSGHNTQPWRFRVEADRLLVLADRSRRLPAVDPDDRALVISVGAALGMLRSAMRAFGYSGAIAECPNPEDADLLATVMLGNAHRPSVRDRDRLAAITRRRTTRRDFGPDPIPPPLSRSIAALEEGGAKITVIADPADKARIAELVAAGDRAQFGNPAFRRELADWVRSRRVRSRDGMSGANFGFPDIASPIGAAVIRWVDMGKTVGEADRRRTAAAPGLALVASLGDLPIDWLKSGMVHADMLLDVTAAGLTAAYCNQPIETSALRPRLAQAARIDAVPQLLLRIGKGPPIAPAVRRPLEEVIET